MYCNKDLVTGEFVDTILGDLIVSTGAELPFGEGGPTKNSYMYWPVPPTSIGWLGRPLQSAS